MHHAPSYRTEFFFFALKNLSSADDHINDTFYLLYIYFSFLVERSISQKDLKDLKPTDNKIDSLDLNNWSAISPDGENILEKGSNWSVSISPVGENILTFDNGKLYNKIIIKKNFLS